MRIMHTAKYLDRHKSKETTLNIVKAIIGKLKRKPSNRAQLIALPNAVMVYTDEGSIIVTPQLAKDIQEKLPEITRQAENKSKKAEKKNE